MLQRLLIITLTLCSLTASAQWQQTGAKVRYVNGLGIPTKDTAAGVAADSSQILIRPADSSLYIKYKRTWVKVGAGGTIGGSGTTNYVPKFTAGTTLGNSQIFDNGTNVGIGTITPSYKLNLSYTQSSNTFQGFSISASTIAKNYSIFSGNAAGGGLWGLPNPFTGFINYTDAAATSFINDGSGYFSWHNSTTELMRITNAGNVGIGTTSPTRKLTIQDAANPYMNFNATSFSNYTIGSDLHGFIVYDGTAAAYRLAIKPSTGNVLVNTTTDNGVDKLQVSGSMNVSAKATAQNLSVTNNISVTNDINQGSGTANANWTILAKGTSSGWAGRMLGDNATGGFVFQHRDNSPTFVNCWAINANGGIGNTYIYDKGYVINGAGSAALMVNTTSDNGVDRLQVNGSISGIGFKQAYVTKTGAYTATDADYVIDCTSGTFTVTLPASSGRTGRILIIKNSGAGTITVDGNGAETIDGAATYSLAVQYATIQIISDGTNWKIIAKF
jgi:hypothetical protein